MSRTPTWMKSLTAILKNCSPFDRGKGIGADVEAAALIDNARGQVRRSVEALEERKGKRDPPDRRQFCLPL